MDEILMNTKHSKLPPSSAARRMACSGSRALEEKYKLDESNEAAEQGELAHKYSAWKLRKNFVDFSLWVARVPEEMEIPVQTYVDDVLKTAGNQRPQLHIEERVDISTIHSECWGTPDCWYYNPDTRELYIWDFKYGHKFVEVFENWQLIEYAAGILDTLNTELVTNVIFRIVQPRSYHKDGSIREWKTTPTELQRYFGQLQASEDASFHKNPQFEVSSQCDYCSARHVCTALQNAALTASETSRYSLPLELTPEAVGVELKHLQTSIERLKARESGLAAQATALIRKGQRIPNYKLEQTMGREQWREGATPHLRIIAELMGIDICKPLELITPKQAVAKGVPLKIAEINSERKIGALKLVADSDNKTRRIFK
jgi:hypothetical protein